MTRNEATQFAHAELMKNGLKTWSVRYTTDMTKGFLGMCSYADECIILSAQHVDIHDDASVRNTIRHEIAHALTPGHSHDAIWREKAREVGCDNTEPCSNLSFTAEAIDAIRSGATLEVEIEEQIIRTPRYKVTRLQDKCPTCKKVAVEEHSFEFDGAKYIQLKCGHMVIKNIPKATPFDQWISADADPNCAHEWNKNFCTKCDAKRPFKFQVEGMRFLERGLAINKGCAIFDEMGLGKTIQGFGYLYYHREALPALWLVKSGILFQTYAALLGWLPEDPFHFCQIIRTSNDPVLKRMNCYMVSYDLLVPKERKLKNGKIARQGFDIQKFIDRGIKTIILDECQLIKNPDSSRTQQVRRLAATVENVIPLSGTPWKNRGSEFYPVLNMIAPYKFNSYEGFKQRWVDYYWDGNKYKEGGIRNIPAFKEYVKDIVIRREYNEVMDEYPDVSRTLYFYELDRVTQEMYDEEESEFVKWYKGKVVGGEDIMGFGGDNMIAKLSRLRHLLGISKVPATLEYVEDFVEETDKKLVIFVHHVDVMDMIYRALHEKYGDKMPVLKLAGGTNASERFEIQTTFNESKRALLVASTLAAGEGINLQTCADAVLHERQFNPANEDQAAPGRFKRIGQLSSHISIVCVTAHGTVDDHLHGIVEPKRRRFHAAMNKGEVATWDQKDIMKELAEAIVRNHESKKAS